MPKKSDLLPLESFSDYQKNSNLIAGLAVSMNQEMDFLPQVEGQVPKSIQGCLYRNGAGLFDRSNGRKRMLLDGDGLIQMFNFRSGQVRYKNRFVRTKKYVDENKLNKFIYPTFTTRAPGGFIKNFFPTIESSASVTVFKYLDHLIATDEMAIPYLLDPVSLETRGVFAPDESNLKAKYQAHTKWDGINRRRVFLKLEPGPVMKGIVAELDEGGELVQKKGLSFPRPSFFHDWHITPNYYIFVLHPSYVSLPQLVLYELGLNSFIESLSGTWRPEQGNLIFVVPRNSDERAKSYESKAFWMVHAVNAYEEGNELIVDLVGLEREGYSSQSNPLYSIMQGNLPEGKYQAAGSPVTRYRIQLNTGILREEVLTPSGFFEFPTIDLSLSGQKAPYAYLTQVGQADYFWSAISRLHLQTGKLDTYDFGYGIYTSEPIFLIDEEKQGWILTQIYNGHKKESALAILSADSIQNGPVALVNLGRPCPMGFHGSWVPSL